MFRLIDCYGWSGGVSDLVDAVTSADSQRLFRYDGRIVLNIIAATFSRWSDRIIAGLVLVIGMGALCASFLALSWHTASWVAAASGLTIGIACERAIGTRLKFHSTDGSLTADALIVRLRRRYAAGWRLSGAGLLAIVAVVVGPWLIPSALAGYATGIAITVGIGALELPYLPHLPRSNVARSVLSWLQRPRAGLWATALLILFLVPLVQSLSHAATLAAAGLLAAMLMLALTGVNDGVVRFMASVGYGPSQTVWRLMRGAVLFVATSAAVCAIGFSPLVGGVVGSVGLVGLLLGALRVLAYRLHGKRIADWLVAILSGLLGLVATSMPLLLPVLVVAILWQMQRRAVARTWEIA